MFPTTRNQTFCCAFSVKHVANRRLIMPLIPILIFGVPVVLVGGYYLLHVIK